MKIHRSVNIAASDKKIWPFLVEPLKIIKWCYPAKKFDIISRQKSGAGTRFYFEEYAAGRLMKLHFVVTECVENKRVAFTMTSGNVVKRYEQSYTIETIPSGCRCTCFEEVKLPYGILGHFALIFRQRFSEGLLDAMLNRLKFLAET